MSKAMGKAQGGSCMVKEMMLIFLHLLAMSRIIEFPA
jgi:hypothetical protein